MAKATVVVEVIHAPAFIRLPRPPARCPHTGLTRNRLEALVVPCVENHFKPPVKSITEYSESEAVTLRLVDSTLAATKPKPDSADSEN